MGTHVLEEILEDILSRLPVKSLLRFKCVSKSWKTLISQPYFQKKHLKHAKDQPNSQKKLLWSRSPNDKGFHCSSLSLVRLVKDIRRFDWPSNYKPSDGINIYSCGCDGLFKFLVGIWSKTYQKDPSILLIWNPSTEESIVLPHSELSTYGFEYTSTSDDYEEGSIYGLGYDSISDDYKVLRIDLSEGYQEDKILTLKSGSWRKLDETSGRTDKTLLLDTRCLVFVHGAFHWLGLLSRNTVVSFNISYEKYGEIPLPEIMCLLPLSEAINIELDAGLSLLAGMLCVYYNDERTFNLWVMKDYGAKESWTNLFNIPSNGVHFITPIYMFSNDEVLLSCEEWESINIVYRIISGRSFGFTNQIWPLDCDDIDAVTIDQDGIVYMESLISPTLSR